MAWHGVMTALGGSRGDCMPRQRARPRGGEACTASREGEGPGPEGAAGRECSGLPHGQERRAVAKPRPLAFRDTCAFRPYAPGAPAHRARTSRTCQPSLSPLGCSSVFPRQEDTQLSFPPPPRRTRSRKWATPTCGTATPRATARARASGEKRQPLAAQQWLRSSARTPASCGAT